MSAISHAIRNFFISSGDTVARSKYILMACLQLEVLERYDPALTDAILGLITKKS